MVRLASLVGACNGRAVVGAGLDLLVPCVLREFSLWTISFCVLNCLSVFGQYGTVAWDSIGDFPSLLGGVVQIVGWCLGRCSVVGCTSGWLTSVLGDCSPSWWLDPVLGLL